MKKHTFKKQKNDRLSPQQRGDSKSVKNLPVLTNNSEVKLVPLEIDSVTGMFKNVHLFGALLPTIEEFADVFGDDSLPNVADYNEWMTYQVRFVKGLAPWIFIVLVDDMPQGLCWAINWGTNGTRDHDVQICGLAKRETPIGITTKTIHALLGKIFSQSDVYIVRASCAKGNRAASLAMLRAGLTHPESQRSFMLKNGAEIDGIIRSITRPEWEILRNV